LSPGNNDYFRVKTGLFLLFVRIYRLLISFRIWVDDRVCDDSRVLPKEVLFRFRVHKPITGVGELPKLDCSQLT